MEQKFKVKGIQVVVDVDWVPMEDALAHAVEVIIDLVENEYISSDVVKTVIFGNETMHIEAKDESDFESGYYLIMYPHGNCVRLYGPYPNPFCMTYDYTGEMPHGS